MLQCILRRIAVHLLLAVHLLFIQVLLAVVCFGQSAGNRAQFVIAGFIAGREKLITGEFTAVGHLDLSQRTTYPVEGDIEIFAAFDYAQQKLRFDRLQPFWIRPEPDQPKVLGKYGGRLIRTVDATIAWGAGDSRGVIYPPNSAVDRAIAPFLPRSVGALNWATLDRETNWESLVEILSRPVHSAKEVSAGVVEIAWFHPVAVGANSGHGFVYSFDTTRDCVPIAYDEYDVATNGEVSEWRQLVGRGRTEWVQINDVWVPSKLEEQTGSHLQESRTLDFHWRKVNEPVDEALFTIDGLGVPAPTVFFDDRGPKPGKVFTSAFRQERESKRAFKHPPLDRERSSGTTWIIWFNIAAALLFAVLVWWKRMSHPRSKA